MEPIILQLSKHDPTKLVDYLIFNPLYSGTQTGISYSNFSDFLWENYSSSFSLIRRFNQLKIYEKKYNMSSAELFTKWKSNSLNPSDELKNYWLTLYLQIKEYLNE